MRIGFGEGKGARRLKREIEGRIESADRPGVKACPIKKARLVEGSGEVPCGDCRPRILDKALSPTTRNKPRHAVRECSCGGAGSADRRACGISVAT